MNTPAHLIFGMAAFGRKDVHAVTWAAAVGALIPDLSLYLLAGVHLLVLGTEPEIVFGQMYYSEAWQRIFRVDNSFIIWGLGLVLAFMARAPVAIALTGAALLHLLLDFPLHNDDARAHFWPFTNWKFISPVSYWDRNHYGQIVAPIEALAVLGCSVLLWRRYAGGWIMRCVVTMIAALQILPFVAWVFLMGEQ